MEFFKFVNNQITWISELKNLTNFQNFTFWKIKISSDFFQFGKLSKFEKLANLGIVCPFGIPHHSQFRQFLYLPFDMN